MAEESQTSTDIQFVYEKARHHRTLHADGAWSAVTPHAEVQVSFYNDLRRIPATATLSVREDNTVIPSEPVVVSELIREVDVTVVMNVEVAKATVALLNQMIAQAEQALEKAASRQRQSPEDSKVDTRG
jgi:hypothetical protein